MDNIILQNKELTTFEDFAAQVYSPLAPKGLFTDINQHHL